jgi:hypothetical protein
MRAAAVAQRAEAVERQAAASERALEGLRSAIARPAASAGNGRPRATTPPSPPTTEPTKPTKPTKPAMKPTADPTIQWAAEPPAQPTAAPAADAEPLYELETMIVEETDVRPIERRASPVPRARRVERRMLRIDDRDDAQWRPLDRRQAALSELLDEPGH